MSYKCPIHYNGQDYWARAECKLCEESLLINNHEPK